MAKKKFSFEIEAGKFLIVESQNIDAFMSANNFSDETKKQVADIRQKFVYADMILFFFE